jgi:hypothetical protein
VESKTTESDPREGIENHRMNLTKRVLSGTFIALGIVCVALGLAQQNQNTKTLVIGSKAEIRFSAPWQPSAVQYSNAQELVARHTEPTTPGVTATDSGKLLARMLITTESRTSHTDALKRLQDVAASRNAPAEFLEIGGWPAVEIKFTELLPRTGAKGEKEDETHLADVTLQRIITAVAQDDKVVVMDTSFLPSTPQALVNSAKDITRSLRFPKRADPTAVKKALETMRQSDKERKFKKPHGSRRLQAPARHRSSPWLLRRGRRQGCRFCAPLQIRICRFALEVVRAPNWVNWKSLPALMPGR